MITAFHHVGVSVHNLERALAFWQQSFGFVLAPGFIPVPDPTVDERQLALCAPNCFVELIETTTETVGPAERGVHEPGITHVCVQSHLIEALYARCVASGARSGDPLVELGTGNIYCYAHDSEANIIELEGLPYAPIDQVPWVGHVAIATPDIERLASFYHQLLGGARLGGQKIGPNLLYDQLTGLEQVELIPTWIVGGNVSLELWQYIVPPTLPQTHERSFTEPGYSHLCFEVVNLTAVLAAMQAAGARQISPPRELPGGAVAFVRDPDGNLLELLELEQAHSAYSVGNLPQHAVIQRVAALRR